MKRKFIAILMTGIMIWGLSACGNKPADNDIPASESTQTEEESREMTGTSTDALEPVNPRDPSLELGHPTETMEPISEPTPAPTAEPEVVPEKKEEYLKITREYVYDSCFEETMIAYGHYNTLNLESTEYPELTKAVNSYNALLSNEMQAAMDKLEEWGLDEYREYGAESFRGPYVLENDSYIRRADSEVLSVIENVYEYAGGAHGNKFFGFANIDVATGEDLALEDVIVELSLLPGILETELREKYPEVEYWNDSLYSMLAEYVEPTSQDYQPTFTWTLDYEGVTFYFSDYEISSYVDGTQQVTVTYSEYPSVFNKKFFVGGAEKNYVLQLPDSWRISDVDLYGDGKTDYISVRRNYTGEGENSDSYDVTVNGNTLTQDMYCYDLDTYLVKSEEDYYLYVHRTMENDYQIVNVYKITDTSVESVGEFEGGVEMFTNSKEFEVSRRFDLLSTYQAVAKCYVGEDGLPVEYNNTYKVLRDMVLTSITDMTVDLIDEEGNLLGSTYTFPAGTTYRFIATDGSSFVDVEMSDGQRGRLYVTSGWPIMVNGIDAEELFEMLYFAG